MHTPKAFADSASLAYVRRHLRLVRVAALTPVLMGMGALTGCVSDDSSSSPDDAGAPVDANYVSAQPPSPSGVPTNVTASHNFAIHHIHLGDEIDPATNAPDWPRYGYDLDHKNTTPTSTDVCKLATDTSLKNQVDGPGGIDNSFGENIVPLLAAVMANPSMVENTALAAGQFTLMLDVNGLDESNVTQTATGLSGQIFGGVGFDQGPNASASDAGTSAPTFTTADDWPLDPSFLPGGVVANPAASNEVFAAPYVTNGTFVGSAGTELNLTLIFPAGPVVLKIQHPVVTFVNDGTHAGSGILSGVILTQDMASAAQIFEQTFSSSCAGQAQVMTAVQQAADIMHDESNTAGVACDAISFAIGFDADEIGAPAAAGVPAAYPATVPCVDGGVANGG
jgi:hypothetical protein